MLNEEIIKYQLLEDMLEQGLEAVCAYLRSVTSKLFVICNDAGKIYYPYVVEGIPELLDKRYIGIPDIQLSNQEYFYHEMSHNLFFGVGKGNLIYAYIVVYQWENCDLDDILPALRNANLAVKSYFANLQSMETAEKSVRSELLQNLLFFNNANIREVLKKAGNPKLDINQKYFLVLIEPDEEFNIDTLYSYSKEWLTSRGWVHHTCIVWIKTLIVICPVHFKQQTLEIDSNWERHYVNIRQHKKDMEKKFNIGLSFAIGEKYSPVELHRSYTEAKTTMNINRLMGEKNFLKHFHDQGIFSLLYLHDPELLKEHCYKTLGKLIQHDREYKTELMDALRMLLDSNMNWKETAGKLFIHVNTLHYRMNKVQELLGLDLGTLHNQADLYITLKLYDSLVANGFIKE